ncbi:hypothetical protein [Pyrobaculum sp.]|uniref:hypothetical protein n=1 Tax=Pyrobaculum sp. TaxID=2004705 RepID=UPI003D0B1F8A
MKLILDASTIITFKNANKLNLLADLQRRGVEIIVPRAVLDELYSAGHVFEDPPFTSVQPREGYRIETLGAGEAEAIQLCKEYVERGEEAELVTDDARARRKAERLGLKVMGTLGLVILLAKRGVVSPCEATGLLHELSAFIYVTNDVLEKAKKALQEMC